MDTFQTLGTPNRSRFGVFKLSKPKRLKSRHGLPDKIADGAFVYRAVMQLDDDVNWGTWLGEQRDAAGSRRPVLLKHTGEENRTRAGADALWLEALLALKLGGPQVAELLDYGVLDGRPFAVYEPVDGVSLSQVLEGLEERGARLPAGVAVAIVLQVCEVIGRLHRVSIEDEQTPPGFVHGSLCPRNLVLTTRGDVKVMGLVGSRPMGRVVGRQHVPAAALRYASPQLLEGEPVSPVVDVHSLGAVLLEMLGPSSDEKAELGLLLRQQLSASPTGGVKTIDAFAELLQDAVRRTGTVVARQSIGAQVREASEQELIERRKLIRAQLEAPWGDEESEPKRGNGAGGAISDASTRDEAVEDFTEETLSDLPQDEPKLAQYDEATSDDAVTRIYTGPELQPEPSEAVAPPSWIESSPPPPAKSGWARWTIATALVVIAAVSSVAAIMATRSEPEARADKPSTEKVAGTEKARAAASPVAQVIPMEQPVAEPVAAATPPVVSDDETSADEDTANQGSASQGSANQGSANQGSASAERAERRTRARGANRSVAARTPRQRSARRSARSAERPAAAAEAAPAEPAAPQEEPAESEAAPVAAAREAEEPAGTEDLEIEDPAAVAFLSVDATPYATIFIDGEKKGITPIVSLRLAPGPHRMVAKTEDGKVKRFSLLLESGQTERVKVTWDE
jgi:hypothetical protein